MDDYKLIKNIFTNFKVEGKEIPVEFIKYKGSKKTYITYMFTEDDPGVFGDDEEIDSVVYLDIDIFSEGNYLTIVKEVIKIMKENNFIRVNTSPDMFEEDTGLYHKTIEFAKERMI